MVGQQFKITAVCSSTHWGGTEKWVLRACEELAKRNHNVTMIVRDEELFRTRMRHSFPLIQLPFRNDADLQTIFKLIPIFKASDIIILTRVRDYWLGGIAAKLTNKSVLLRLGIVRKLRENYIKDRLRYGWFPTRTIVNANQIKQVLTETSWINPNDIHVIYNGVSPRSILPDQEKENAKKKLGFQPDCILVVGAGRLTEVKRWDWFVDGIVLLISKGIGARGILFGEGVEMENLKGRVSQKGLESDFLLPGYTTNLNEYLDGADIVVLPSMNEGISNLMLEAMGCSVPVLITESGGVKEKFTDGENIMITGRDNYAEFMNRLVILAKDSELRKTIGENGLEKVKNDFSWSSMTDSLEKLIKLTVDSK
ncbi:glycosyltransferase family 4 protein [bacterium]|nr:glycosyltransferase family 4 protein [bacterium]